MDAKDAIVAAMKAVEEASVPDDLRATAFAKAFDMFSKSNGKLGDRADHFGEKDRYGERLAPSEDLLGRIGEKLGVDRSVVAEVYEQSELDIEVVVAPSKLDRSKMGATKQVALLVAAGRQAAGLEETTRVDKIREAAELYGIHDPNNFARAITDMSDDFIISGSSRTRIVRLRRPAWDRAKNLVIRLEGGEGTAG